MKPELAKRLRLLASALSILALLAALAFGWFWWRLHASLPLLDGTLTLPGLLAPVKVKRDARGVPTIQAENKIDLLRTLGWLHAQDRFFQMDLQRRRASGELAELLGNAALPLDRATRIHRFRTIAQQALALLPAEQKTQIEAYTAGINAGLASLKDRPFEYIVLRTSPALWLPEDSLLVGYAMWLDLQDNAGTYERSIITLRAAFGSSGPAFFAPTGTSWDAALDGTSLPQAPIPGPEIINLRLQPLAAQNPSKGLREDKPQLGSNQFGVGGGLTGTGSALLASDMHLHLAIPTIWYRASLSLQPPNQPQHHVTGVTLPGLPMIIAGSNGQIAWSFTDTNADTTDLVAIDADAKEPDLYRTPEGWKLIRVDKETLKVKDAPSEELTIRSTIWGPVIGAAPDGRPLALHWLAHFPAATDFTLGEMAEASDVASALVIAHRAGIPAQNILIADSAGTLAWSVAGHLPKRIGFDGRISVSWSYGDRRWDGFLQTSEIPQIIASPDGGRLWTANNRIVGGEALNRLGDSGYDLGARARQIRDDLQALAKPVKPDDLLKIQLDDRAVFLERWQKRLLTVLAPSELKGHPARAELRHLVETWSGRAEPDSAGYRLVRTFRQAAAERVLTPIFERCTDIWDAFDYANLPYEDALWRLMEEKPMHLLNPKFMSWDDVMLAAVDDTLAAVKKAGLSPAKFTWGTRNTAHIIHPFGYILPGFLTGWLAMPSEPLPGDTNMPRVQAPDYGASERFVVSPGHEETGIFHMPGGQSGHPLSPFFSDGHSAWVHGEPTPFLPGPTLHTLSLNP